MKKLKRFKFRSMKPVISGDIIHNCQDKLEKKNKISSRNRNGLGLFFSKWNILNELDALEETLTLEIELQIF